MKHVFPLALRRAAAVALAALSFSIAAPGLAAAKGGGKPAGPRPAAADRVDTPAPAAQPAAVDAGAPTAAGPANARPSIVVLARDPSSPAKGKMLAEIGRERGVDYDFVLVDTMPSEAIAAKLAGHDLVLFDWAYDAGFQALLAKTRDALASFDGRIWGGPMWKRPDVTKGLSPEQAGRLFDYYHNGGVENFRRMTDYIVTDIFGRPGKRAAAPIILPERAIYHPDAPQKIFATLADYLKWRAPKPGQKVIAIGFHRIDVSNDALLHIDDLIHRIEKKGAFALPFWDPNEGRKIMPLLTGADGKILPDALIAFTGLYTTVDEQVKFAAAFDRPILQAITYGTGYEDEWRKSEEGLPLFRMGVYYSLAEMAGRIDNTLVAARRRSDDRLVAIPEQMDALAERALGQANLRHKPNKDKKLAILVWNSPEGEENFSASYLNIPASIVEIAKSLRKEGYDAPDLDEKTVIANIKKLLRPYYRTKDDAELRKLVAEGLADRVPVKEYRKFIATLPEDVQKALAEGWEKPEDTYLTLKEGDRADFIVPVWRAGNLFIMPQPLRGARRSEEADILHDKKRPMHHAFRAVYYDIVHKQKVDAIVHLGLHGTQEWALGKERAPSVFDDTQTTIGNVPIIYPYAAHGPGEAIIARRRGRAVIVSHNEPPYAPSGLYGDIAELDTLVHQYETARESAMKAPLERQIVEKAKKLNILADIAMSEADVAADFGKFFEKLDKYMHTMAGMPQPLGFHTFGKVASPNETLLTILQIVGPDYLKAFGEDEPEHVFAQPYQEIEKHPAFLALHEGVVDRKDLASFPEAARPHLEEARKLYEKFTHPMELQNFSHALSGGFIPTSTGGDPLRNPEVVPTGRNLYTFDPRKIPTKAAWEAGSKLGRELMEKYKSEHGVYPDKVAFSLWQTETVIHLGVVEAQILYMLGVEPVWNQRGDVTGVKVLTRAELDRPRVDTILSLTGLYRDNLPELMNLLQGAVNKVAALKEDDNPVALNVQRTLQMLLARGVDAEKAKRLARVRMFGNESGVYGTKLPEATVASGIWDKESTLAETYLDRMSFIFGMEPDLHSVKIDGLNLYAEALHGTKAAVLSRSNNAHGIVSLDHPFEYLGGIGLAVRHLDGKTPELYLSDLRNTREFKTESVAEFLSLELRSRMFHPRYIEGLMRERYAGATKMVDNLNNFWGWNVMDRDSVRADQWQEFYEIYIKDKYALGLKEYFKTHHPAALAQIADRMLEAVRKGYWDAPEEVVRTLVETHEEIARTHDLNVGNDKLAEFLKAKAAGFGLLASSAPNAATPAAPQEASAQSAPEQTAATETVTGQKLERKEVAEPTQPSDHFGLYALLFGSFGLGAAWEIAQAWFIRRRLA